MRLSGIGLRAWPVLVVLCGVSFGLAVSPPDGAVKTKPDKAEWEKSADSATVAEINNEHLRVRADAVGNFTIHTADGKWLLWGNDPQSTSTTIAIDGYGYWNDSGHSFGTVVEAVHVDGGYIVGRWQVGEIEIALRLAIVYNSYTGQNDIVEIRWTLRNTGGSSHTVGCRLLLDVQIDDYGGAPLQVPGTGIVYFERDWTGAAVPRYYEAFDYIGSGSPVIHGTLSGGQATVPDRFTAADWENIIVTIWDYTVNPSHDIYTDLATTTFWNPQPLAAGASRSYLTYYGLSGLTGDLAAPLATGLAAPKALECVNNAPNPNPFNIYLSLVNDLSESSPTITGIQASLTLPTGLSLASGSATIAVPNLDLWEGDMVSWLVNVGAGVSGTKNFSVAINTNQGNKTMQGSVNIPACGCTGATVGTHPQNQTISSGQTATLTVTASGTAPISYQWYQGPSGTTTTPVGTNSNSYTTPALTATTSYWVKVTNGCGTANSTTATVTVCTGVSIGAHPQSQTIATGQTATLTVTAGGTPPFNYQWYQGSSGTTTTPVGTNSSSYTTPALSTTTSYWVKVTNGCGTANSNTATITVTACTLPSIGTPPQSQVLSTGNTATLTVTASGTAPLTYQWYQGPSGTTTTPVGTNSNSYTTPALSATTSYWVKVTNGCGSANSAAATVTVLQRFTAAAAYTPGAGTTFWQTDASLWNYGTSDASVVIALLKANQSNLNPQLQTVTVPAGKGLLLSNILNSTFSTSNAGLGFGTTSSSVLIESRFYNTASACGGTYGMFVPCLATTKALRSSKASQGSFHFLRYSTNSSTGFRTNLGFVSGSAFNVQVEIRLFNDSGQQIGNPLPYTLRPFEHYQYTRVHEWVSSPSVTRGTAKIKVLTVGGEVYPYAMVIDNVSGDPIYMPAGIQ